MTSDKTSPELIVLLNRALARELQVSVQYMLQHAIGAGRMLAGNPLSEPVKLLKFVANNALYFLPGMNLKKIAITEMRHAEAISERIVILGGEPTTEHSTITISKTMTDMLADDREQERGAIEMYKKIIIFAEREKDRETEKLFRHNLKDEEKHHHTFSTLIE